ncbi:hypothetical protein NFI96_032768 [Prochilodus magdalenae]|nr:hypothetical protein NFI96_032768 [Prochilodus magdalenae]
MTKPKLDACEQRWVAKLAPYTFDIKHIPGRQNVVADALSRDPFAKTVGHRLLSEQYSNLLCEAEGVSEDGVQDTFRLKVQCHKAKAMSTSALEFQTVPCPSSLSAENVQALYESYGSCEIAAETRAAQCIQSIQQFSMPGQDALPTLSLQELQQHQEQDSVISSVLPFVVCKRRPSRREKAKLSSNSLGLVKQWEKLHIQDGILYRVSKDPLSKHSRLKHQWPQQIQTLTFAYNATVHETSGFAPFQLMFGRVPRLPVDVMFQHALRDSVVVGYDAYVETLMSYLQEASKIAQQHATKEHKGSRPKVTTGE